MKRGLKLVMFISVPLIVGILVFAAVRFGWFGISAGAAANTAQAKVQKELTYSLGDFMVNLDEPGYKRYIKVKIFAGYTESELEAQLTEKAAEIGDNINGILRSKKLDDVNTTAKTDTVKKEIRDKINSILADKKLTNIYFKEILIQ